MGIIRAKYLNDIQKLAQDKDRSVTDFQTSMERMLDEEKGIIQVEKQKLESERLEISSEIERLQ
jgi:hypothetical protein